jgi:hypothetical protein
MTDFSETLQTNFLTFPNTQKKRQAPTKKLNNNNTNNYEEDSLINTNSTPTIEISSNKNNNAQYKHNMLRARLSKQISTIEEYDNKKLHLIESYIQVLCIGEVDTMNERFQAEVYIRSSWFEDYEIDEYDPYVHWNPKLFIQNGAFDLKEEISYTVSKLDGVTVVTETRIARGFFWERIELQNFPLDIQEISITLTTRRHSDTVKIVSSERPSNMHPEVLNTFRDQQKWRLYDLVDISGTASYDQTPMNRSEINLVRNNSNININNNNTLNNTELVTFIPNNKSKLSKLVITMYCSRRAGKLILFYLIKKFTWK